MDDSILDTIKKLLGISISCNDFDSDIIIHINTVFMILNQLGVKDNKNFMISDSNSKWKDYISESDNLESIKTYIYLKVRMIFDPPISNSVANAINNTIHELEWRLNMQVEHLGGDKDVEVPTN